MMDAASFMRQSLCRVKPSLLQRLDGVSCLDPTLHHQERIYPQPLSNKAFRYFNCVLSVFFIGLMLTVVYT